MALRSLAGLDRQQRADGASPVGACGRRAARGCAFAFPQGPGYALSRRQAHPEPSTLWPKGRQGLSHSPCETGSADWAGWAAGDRRSWAGRVKETVCTANADKPANADKSADADKREKTSLPGRIGRSEKGWTDALFGAFHAGGVALEVFGAFHAGAALEILAAAPELHVLHLLATHALQ